jgi:PAS domain S-box-containing protein
LEKNSNRLIDKKDYFQRLATVLSDSYDAITVQDLEGRILAWNRGAELMYGFGEDEATQINIMNIIPSEKKVEADALMIDLFKKKNLPPFETQRTTKDGRTIDVWLTATALLDDEGQPYAIATTERDITERKKSAESLKAKNKELEAFAYTVAHDLRTPLTPIIGFAEFVRDNYRQQLDKQALDCLTEIVASGEKMMTIMEDLLRLAKVGYVEPPAEPIESAVVVDEVVCELANQLSDAGMVVEKDTMPSVLLPKTLLTQIFSNLIGNAVRYAAKNGSAIEVGGERRGSLLRFYVRDHGPGITEEERELVFDVFYRGATGKNHSGTGIGLATVQKILKLYEGGRIWFEETEGGGSTFWVELMENQCLDS